MEYVPENTLTDKVIGGMKKAIEEIEELQVQIALGKAEAKDLYEDLKKKFAQKINETKNKFNSFKNDESVLKMINAIEFLEVQLALGIAESKETFEEQRKIINDALHQLETHLQNARNNSVLYSLIHLEIEKFRIKLELLSLHYRVKKVSTKYNFELRKEQLTKKLEKMGSSLMQKEQKAKEKWSLFADEMNKAFNHFKKAFS